MATLAAQILIDWQANRDTVVQVAQSNAFSAGASVGTAFLTTQAGKAATMVKRYLGSVDGTDEEAVEIGVECMDYKLNVARNGFTAENIETKRLLTNDLKDLQAARVDEESVPYVLNPDDVDDED